MTPLKVMSFILMAALVMTSMPTHAATAKASVGSTKVASGEMFRFRVAVDALVSREDIDLSPLDKDFDYGRIQFSNRSANINGNITRKSEWNMTLMTTKTGQVVIPSLEIDGIKTDPITLTVSQGAPLPDVKDLVEVVNSIDKDTLYLGETAKITTKLLIKTDPYSLQDPELTAPQSDNVTIKALGQQNQFTTVIDGVNTIMVTQDYQVSPDKAGQITIQPIHLKATIVQRDANNRQRMIPVDIKAKPIVMNVKGKPDDYQGAWLPTSSLSLMQTWTDSQGKPLDSSQGKLDAKVGTPITRTIRLKVKDLESDKFPELAIYYPKGVRVYNEKPKYDRDAKGFTVMTLKQVIMPREAGNVTLPSVEVPWWDTQSQSKQMAQVDGLKLAIKPDPNAPVDTSPDKATQTEPAPQATPEKSGQNLAPETQPQAPEANQALPQGEKTQAQASDLGIWPWVAGVFALLWLVTLMLWLKARGQKQGMRVSQSADSGTKPTTDLADLRAALAANDGMKVSLWVKQWQQNTSLNHEEHAKVQSALDNVMRGLYQSQDGVTEADKSALIQAIESAATPQSTTQKSTLAHL